MKIPRIAIIATCAVLAVVPGASIAGAQTTASDCPNGGTIRFGVEPYEDAALLAPAYQPLSDALGKALSCNVELDITTNYTAEIEAMRSGKLDIPSSDRSRTCSPRSWRMPSSSLPFRTLTATRRRTTPAS